MAKLHKPMKKKCNCFGHQCCDVCTGHETMRRLGLIPKDADYTPLTFERLRRVNVKRCRKAFHRCITDWSLAEWSNAMAGECGEACNITKKLLRGDKKLEEYREALGKEIADVVVYADLLAAAAGIDLEEAVIQKFNEVSDRKKSKIKL